MDAPLPSASFRGLAHRAAGFVGLGLVLYALLFAAAEQLALGTGHANPLFKVATLQAPAVDWVILGTSHAMPLDFGGAGQRLQRDTGARVLNLAATGAGPLYSRFVFEQFLREHRTRNVLFAVDSFAFASRSWNEERFEDAKLLARTPFDRGTATALWGYVRRDGVPARAWLDYVTGFSKINNRDRFKTDAWEGEAQFDRAWRPSASAVDKRIKYLFPDGARADERARYIGELSKLIAVATRSGAQVVVVKLPTPPQYRSRLPDEGGFDAALAAALARGGVRYRDFSEAMPQAQFYFDSDHLNRAGVDGFIARHLAPLLAAGSVNGARL